jgi:hypothetical protein
MKQFSYKMRQLLSKIKLIFSLPNTWVSLIILAFAIIALVVSIFLNRNGDAFAASIISNISAGLITGFAITVMSNVKSTHCAILEAKKKWLEETHKMILDFLDMHHHLYSAQKFSNEERYDFVYDVVCRASWVNTRIMQGTFNNAKWFDPPRYFLRWYKYDAISASLIIGDCREQVINADCLDAKNTEVLFESVYALMLNLNKRIVDDIRTINTKIVSSRKSFL